MKALRIILRQNQANYRIPEAVINKMTYPLPPFATVIGAIHSACGWTSYHPMRLSVQGGFESKSLEAVQDHAYLNSTFDDRGILVKLQNPNIYSSQYTVVARELKQGCSFYKAESIAIENEALLKEYVALREENYRLQDYNKTVLKPMLAQIKEETNSLNNELKATDNEEQIKEIKSRLQELKEEKNSQEQTYKNELQEKYTEPYSYFATLTKSLRYYEVLHNVKLILHVQSEDETLESILHNIHHLTSIGRSEDFVQLEDARIVELMDVDDDMICLESAYINCEAFDDFGVEARKVSERVPAEGTRYEIRKEYKLSSDKKIRIFEKIPVIYISNFTATRGNPYFHYDRDGYVLNLN